MDISPIIVGDWDKLSSNESVFTSNDIYLFIVLDLTQSFCFQFI